jgi:hypothetical protein
MWSRNAAVCYGSTMTETGICPVSHPPRDIFVGPHLRLRCLA